MMDHIIHDIYTLNNIEYTCNVHLYIKASTEKIPVHLNVISSSFQVPDRLLGKLYSTYTDGTVHHANESFPSSDIYGSIYTCRIIFFVKSNL